MLQILTYNYFFQVHFKTAHAAVATMQMQRVHYYSCLPKIFNRRFLGIYFLVRVSHLLAPVSCRQDGHLPTSHPRSMCSSRSSSSVAVPRWCSARRDHCRTRHWKRRWSSASSAGQRKLKIFNKLNYKTFKKHYNKLRINFG